MASASNTTQMVLYIMAIGKEIKEMGSECNSLKMNDTKAFSLTIEKMGKEVLLVLMEPNSKVNSNWEQSTALVF